VVAFDATLPSTDVKRRRPGSNADEKWGNRDDDASWGKWSYPDEPEMKDQDQMVSGERQSQGKMVY
jgi:hypothetical protein